MARRQGFDAPQDCRHGHIDRRSFLGGAGRLAVGGLTAAATFEMMRPTYAWAQQVANETHAASAQVLDRLRTRFMFQISVDVATVEQGLAVARHDLTREGIEPIHAAGRSASTCRNHPSRRFQLGKCGSPLPKQIFGDF